MSHALTETPTRAQPVTVPDDGDVRNAASVDTPFQALVNRVAYLEAQSMGAGPASGVQYPMITGRDTTSGAGAWTYSAPMWLQSDVSGVGQLSFEIDIPPGCVLQSATVTLAGSHGSDHTGLPATLPTFALVSFRPATGGSPIVTTVATASDTSANQPAYDAAHTITLTGPFTLSADRRYMLRVTGEAGSNSAASKLQITGITLSWAQP